MRIGLQGMFGLIPFTCSSEKVLTYHDLTIERSSRYASHDVLGQKPVNEFVGPAANTVSFTIQLRSDLGSPPRMYLNLLQEMLESGESYRLILGTDYLGKFILNSFSEERKAYDGYGGLMLCDVSLNLTEASGFSLIAFAKTLISSNLG